VSRLPSHCPPDSSPDVCVGEDAVSHEEIAELDSALKLWRQGDAILDGAPPFVFLADMARPLSQQAQQQAAAGSAGIDVVDATGPGLAVVSQTCNIVRSCAQKPTVDVCPLVVLPSDALDEARRGRRPQYAALSGLAAEGLVVDLDRTMTIEKAILVPLTNRRISGVESENEARAFANAIARNRNRSALPEVFVRALEPIRARIMKKHGRNTPEGRFLAGAMEMRVRPPPSWKEVTHLEILFVYERLGNIPDDADEQIRALLARYVSSTSYCPLTGRAVSLETLPTADYLTSDKLDLENLSLDGR